MVILKSYLEGIKPLIEPMLLKAEEEHEKVFLTQLLKDISTFTTGVDVEQLTQKENE